MSDDEVNDSVIDPKPSDVRRHEDFDSSYQAGGTAPWDIGRPQSAFVGLLEAGAAAGRVLDVGCGTGEHALMAAGAGLTAMGIDAAPTAIALAREKAAQRSLEVRFEVADALALSGLGDSFDTVFDCGLFHVFDNEDRARFVTSLGSVVRTGGRYFMLCFSDKEPGDWGPRRVKEEEIRQNFVGGWRVDSVGDAVIELTTRAQGAQAWLAACTRVREP